MQQIHQIDREIEDVVDREGMGATAGWGRRRCCPLEKGVPPQVGRG